MAESEPTIVEMHSNLATDAREHRYSTEVLVSIMRLIDDTERELDPKVIETIDQISPFISLA